MVNSSMMRWAREGYFFSTRIFKIRDAFTTFVIVFIFNLTTLWAGSLTISVDRSTTSLEEPITLQVVVQGIQNAPEPELENISQFEVQKAGASTQIQMINGRTTSSIIHQFVLYPKKEGNFQVGPAVVKMGGQTFQSKSVSLVVVKAAEKVEEKLYFITAEVDKKTAYVHEQVNYTFRFYTRARVANAQLEQPKFSEFWREELGKQKEFQKNIDGVNWVVSEYNVALFPTVSGKIEIGETALAADIILQSRRNSVFDSFFEDSFFSGGRTKRARMRTKSILLEVLPLPEAGKTKYFGGLVGKFKLDSDLSKKSLVVGDSSTLTIALSGSGNLRDAKLLPPEWDKVKVYDDEPVLKQSESSGRLHGTKTFKRAIVPTSEGKLALSPLRIDYFDPTFKQYKTLITNEFQLEVAAGSGENIAHVSGGDSALQKTRVKVLGEDIMPIKRSLGALKSDGLSTEEKRILLGIIFLCPFLYLFSIKMKGKLDRIRGDLGYVKRSKAYNTFQREVKKINGSDRFFEEASNTLRSYLADKLGIDGRAMTADDTERFLSPYALTPETLREVAGFIKECEGGQFGGKVLPVKGRLEMLETLGTIGRKLEREIR